MIFLVFSNGCFVMKLRHFSIRDLLWLTALCAVLVAWWMDHSKLIAELEPVRFENGFRKPLLQSPGSRFNRPSP